MPRNTIATFYRNHFVRDQTLASEFRCNDANHQTVQSFNCKRRHTGRCMGIADSRMVGQKQIQSFGQNRRRSHQHFCCLFNSTGSNGEDLPAFLSQLIHGCHGSDCSFMMRWCVADQKHQAGGIRRSPIQLHRAVQSDFRGFWKITASTCRLSIRVPSEFRKLGARGVLMVQSNLENFIFCLIAFCRSRLPSGTFAARRIGD